MGIPAPIGYKLNNSCLLYFSCGNCEAIEQICLMHPKKHDVILSFFIGISSVWRYKLFIWEEFICN